MVEPAAVDAAGDGDRFRLMIGVGLSAACEVAQERGVMLICGPIDRHWGFRNASEGFGIEDAIEVWITRM